MNIIDTILGINPRGRAAASVSAPRRNSAPSLSAYPFISRSSRSRAGMLALLLFLLLPLAVPAPAVAQSITDEPEGVPSLRLTAVNTGEGITRAWSSEIFRTLRTPPLLTAASPNSRMLFVATYARKLKVLRTRDDGGAPEQLHSYNIGAVSSAWALDMMVSPDGRLLYIMGCLRDSDYTYSISVWRIGADGSLTRLSDTGEDNGDRFRQMDIALSPDGSLLFAKDKYANILRIWQVDQAAGTLSGARHYQQDSGDEITVSPDGRLLFVAGSYDDLISVWRVNAAAGSLEKVADRRGVSGELDSSRVAVSPDGSLLFVASRYGHLSVMGISADGTLSLRSVHSGGWWQRSCTDAQGVPKYAPGVVCTEDGLAAASGITVSPDGTQLYVAARYAHSSSFILTAWNVFAASGTLRRGRTYQDVVLGNYANAGTIAVDPDDGLLLTVKLTSQSARSARLDAWHIHQAPGAVTVTARTQTALDTTATVTVTARQGDSEVMRAAVLRPGALSAAIVYEAGLLSSGEWTFTATAEPAALLDTAHSTATVSVAAPPLPTLQLHFLSGVEQTSASAGNFVEIAVVSERPPDQEVTVVVTARHAESGATRTASAVLTPTGFPPTTYSYRYLWWLWYRDYPLSLETKKAVFDAGELGIGEWTFTAAAMPAGILDTSSATLTVNVLRPALRLEVERTTVQAGGRVPVLLRTSGVPEGNVLVTVSAARAGITTEMTLMVQPPSTRTAVYFSAGTPGTEEWTFTATAQPAEFLDTSSAIATAQVNVLAPPALSMRAVQAAVPAGRSVELLLTVGSGVPGQRVQVTVTARQGNEEHVTQAELQLQTSTQTAVASFDAGELGAGEWTFTAAATPAGLVDTANAAATVTVRMPALSLTAADNTDGMLNYATFFRGLPWPARSHIPSFAASPENSLVFVAAHDRELRVFRVGRDDDDAAPVQLRSYNVGGIYSWAHDMVVSPDGRLLFVMGCLRNSRYSYSISVWRIGADGALTQLSDMGEYGGERFQRMDIALSPDGSLLFAKDKYSDVLRIWQVDRATGALSGARHYQQDSGDEITVSPDGRLLFVAGGTDDIISVWRVNAGDGSLRKVADQRGIFGELDDSRVAVSPDGSQLFVAARSGHLSVMGISADGALSLRSVRKSYVYYNGGCRNYLGEYEYDPEVCGLTTLYRATSIAVSSDGRHVYVGGADSEYSNHLSVWEVSTSGVLSRVQAYRSERDSRSVNPPQDDTPQDDTPQDDTGRSTRWAPEIENFLVDTDDGLLFAIDESGPNGRVNIWRINRAEGAATVTAQTEARLDTELTVTVTARQGDRTVTRTATLDSGALSVTAVFEVGALTPGEWTLTATAEPDGLVNTANAMATVTIAELPPPPMVHLTAEQTQVLAGDRVGITVASEHAPTGEVTVVVTARHAVSNATRTASVVLGPALSSAVTAVFEAGLTPGAWTFTAAAMPAGFLDTSAATATVTVRMPALSLAAAGDTDGTLDYSTSFSGLPWPVTGHRPSLAASPKNSLVFVAAHERTLRVFRVGRDGGAPVQLHSYNIGGINSWAHDMEVSPDGRLLFIMGCLRDSDYSFSLSVWRIGADGSLTRLSDTGSRNGDERLRRMDIALSPDGSLLFAKDKYSAVLRIWQVDKVAGTLSGARQYTQSGGDEVTVSPDGRLLFVAGGTNDLISVWRVNAGDGSLQKAADYRRGVYRELDNSRVAVSPDGSLLFVASEYGHLSVMEISAAGTLTLRSVHKGHSYYSSGCSNYWGHPKYGRGVCTEGDLYSVHSIAVSPDGRHVYVTGRGSSFFHSLSVWTVNTSGTLSRSQAYQGSEAGGIEHLLVDADDGLLFAIDKRHYRGRIGVWRINRAAGAVTVTARTEATLDTTVTVTVRARQDEDARTVTRTAALDPGDLLVTTVFAAGVLTPGEWTLTATAVPAGLVDTTHATATVTVTGETPQPLPVLRLVSQQEDIPEGVRVEIAVTVEPPPPREVTVAVTAHHAVVDRTRTVSVTLNPGISTAMAVFEAGVLYPGYWTFTARVWPANTVNIEREIAAVHVRSSSPVLSAILSATPASVMVGERSTIRVDLYDPRRIEDYWASTLLATTEPVDLIVVESWGDDIVREIPVHFAAVDVIRKSFDAVYGQAGRYTYTLREAPGQNLLVNEAALQLFVNVYAGPPVLNIWPAAAASSAGSTVVITVAAERRLRESVQITVLAQHAALGTTRTATAVLTPRTSTAQAVFAAGALTPGQWLLDALAEPAGVVDASYTSTTLHIEEPALEPEPELPAAPMLNIWPAAAASSAGSTVVITVAAERRLRESVQITVLAQHAALGTTRTATAVLTPRTSTAQAVFAAGALTPGQWLLDALAEPAGVVDASYTSTTLHIEEPALEPEPELPAAPMLNIWPAAAASSAGSTVVITVAAERRLRESVQITVLAQHAALGTTRTATAVLTPRTSTAQAVFAAGALTPGRWLLDALAEPAGVVDASYTSATLHIEEPALEPEPEPLGVPVLSLSPTRLTVPANSTAVITATISHGLPFQAAIALLAMPADMRRVERWTVAAEVLQPGDTSVVLHMPVGDLQPGEYKLISATGPRKDAIDTTAASVTLFVQGVSEPEPSGPGPDIPEQEEEPFAVPVLSLSPTRLTVPANSTAVITATISHGLPIQAGIALLAMPADMRRVERWTVAAEVLQPGDTSVVLHMPVGDLQPGEYKLISATGPRKDAIDTTAASATLFVQAPVEEPEPPAAPMLYIWPAAAASSAGSTVVITVAAERPLRESVQITVLARHAALGTTRTATAVLMPRTSTAQAVFAAGALTPGRWLLDALAEPAGVVDASYTSATLHIEEPALEPEPEPPGVPVLSLSPTRLTVPANSTAVITATISHGLPFQAAIALLAMPADMRRTERWTVAAEVLQPGDTSVVLHMPVGALQPGEYKLISATGPRKDAIDTTAASVTLFVQGVSEPEPSGPGPDIPEQEEEPFAVPVLSLSPTRLTVPANGTAVITATISHGLPIQAGIALLAMPADMRRVERWTVAAEVLQPGDTSVVLHMPVGDLQPGEYKLISATGPRKDAIDTTAASATLFVQAPVEEPEPPGVPVLSLSPTRLTVPANSTAVITATISHGLPFQAAIALLAMPADMRRTERWTVAAEVLQPGDTSVVLHMPIGALQPGEYKLISATGPRKDAIDTTAASVTLFVQGVSEPEPSGPGPDIPEQEEEPFAVPVLSLSPTRLTVPANGTAVITATISHGLPIQAGIALLAMPADMRRVERWTVAAEVLQPGDTSVVLHMPVGALQPGEYKLISATGPRKDAIDTTAASATLFVQAPVEVLPVLRLVPRHSQVENIEHLRLDVSLSAAPRRKVTIYVTAAQTSGTRELQTNVMLSPEKHTVGIVYMAITLGPGEWRFTARAEPLGIVDARATTSVRVLEGPVLRARLSAAPDAITLGERFVLHLSLSHAAQGPATFWVQEHHGGESIVEYPMHFLRGVSRRDVSRLPDSIGEYIYALRETAGQNIAINEAALRVTVQVHAPEPEPPVIVPPAEITPPPMPSDEQAPIPVVLAVPQSVVLGTAVQVSAVLAMALSQEVLLGLEAASPGAELEELTVLIEAGSSTAGVVFTPVAAGTWTVTVTASTPVGVVALGSTAAVSVMEDTEIVGIVDETTTDVTDDSLDQLERCDTGPCLDETPGTGGPQTEAAREQTMREEVMEMLHDLEQSLRNGAARMPVLRRMLRAASE